MSQQQPGKDTGKRSAGQGTPSSTKATQCQPTADRSRESGVASLRAFLAEYQPVKTLAAPKAAHFCAVLDQQRTGCTCPEGKTIGSVIKAFLVLLVCRHSMLHLRGYLQQTLGSPLDLVQLTPRQHQYHRSVSDVVFAEQGLIAKFIALQNQAHEVRLTSQGRRKSGLHFPNCT